MKALIRLVSALTPWRNKGANLPVKAAEVKERQCLVQTYLDTSTSMHHLAEALATQFNSFLDQLTSKWVETGGNPEQLYVSQHAFNATIIPVEDWRRIGQAKRGLAGNIAPILVLDARDPPPVSFI